MKSKIQITLNGKTVYIPIQLNEDQMRQMLAEAGIGVDEVMTGWEEPKIGNKGYFENEFNEVTEFEISESTI